MSSRSTIRGPRFALTNPEKCSACIKCVYGNGEHAPWCLKQDGHQLHPFKVGDECEVLQEGIWTNAHVVEVWPGPIGWITALLINRADPVALLSIARGTIRLPQRAPAVDPQPVETVSESASA